MTDSRRRTFAWTFAALVLGTGTGVAVGRQSKDEQPREATTRRPPATTQKSGSAQQARASEGTKPSQASPTDNGGVIPSQIELRAEITHAVKEAFDERMPSLPRESVEAPEQAATVPSEANWNAYRRSETVLDAALTARRWTESDRRAFRANRSKLTPEQHLQLVERLVAAVNSDQVTVEDRVF
jgi:hypothetical protein